MKISTKINVLSVNNSNLIENIYRFNSGKIRKFLTSRPLHKDTRKILSYKSYHPGVVFYLSLTMRLKLLEENILEKYPG